MGLDTSHDCWHGSYGAFTRWRQKVAEIAGYAVWSVKMEDGITRDTVMIDWGHITEQNLFGEWEQTPSDPLIVIIAHSDCEGVIHPEQGVPLADRLEALLPEIDKVSDEGGGYITARGGFGGATRRFIQGLRAAALAGEDVDFH